MDDNGWTDERMAAEDLRRQLQEKSARKARPSKEEALQWVQEHRDLFVQMMSEMLGRRIDAGEFVDKAQIYLQDVTLPNSYDDLLTHSVVHALCKEVEDACNQLKIPLRSGVAYGSTASLSVEAARFPVHFTEASVVSLSTGFILFCSDVSKVFARSLIHENEREENRRVIIDSAQVYAKISKDSDLKQHWTEVIGGYGYGSGPLTVTQRVVAHPASMTRQDVLWAMERFAVAHEYAHHIAAHGRREFAARGIDSEGLNEEYEADLFALRLSQYLGANDTPQNIWGMSGAAAVLLLKCLDSIRRARQVLLTGRDVLPAARSHPETSDRISMFDKVDPTLPEPEQIAFRDLRDSVVAIIDSIWLKLKVYFVSMHENGLRPENAIDGLSL